MRPPMSETSQEDPKVTAQEVLISVARDALIRDEYPVVSDAIDDASLREIVNLAWRFQFDRDRHPFRREIRQLQEYVGKRVREHMQK